MSGAVAGAIKSTTGIADKVRSYRLNLYPQVYLSLPAGVSIGVGALRKREQINHRNRGQGPLLQVKSLPAGVPIGVGALRKRD